ncbi:hypothetical protein D7W82_39365 [Corallococcus sp. CA049B]|uniref:hypothetical protein n=1 Tax=Corallococcus sp. CA049B TaxID=2316730 RepID=UPI000EA29DB8|nr:hypothetical protein [Corallococcus sp. CA049B]NOJ98589.1 hypothetical protein [Corallococcus coralloides]RKG72905.1 hypothetical protein D7W82_39365 [Corallococcus sp. CA049B]
MEEQDIYDIYLRAFIAGRMQLLVNERRDLVDYQGTDNQGIVHVAPFTGQKLAAFAMGLADAGVDKGFPRAKSALREQLSRLTG